jgi:environmental stress-induced protein Ves
VRISMADIDSDGPFSAFPGVERWFSVVTGAGVILGLDGAEKRVRAGDAPVQFDGAAAPSCRLIDGPTRDLNLMVKGGSGGMWPVSPGAAWTGDLQVRALFTAVPGRWSDGSAIVDLPQYTLLFDDAGAGAVWRFEPKGLPAVQGWWLGHTPR